eukprot:m.22938 g.22938  ORF g.22938 m.22938 type:complete len:1111 (+) comp5887_c0_seq1:65-3397(+)
MAMQGLWTATKAAVWVSVAALVPVAAATQLSSGPMTVTLPSTSPIFTLSLAKVGNLSSLPPTVTVTPTGAGAAVTCPLADLGCAPTPATPTAGSDEFGHFQSVSWACSCHSIPLVYTVRAYSEGVRGSGTVTPRTGVLMFQVSLPNGANVGAVALNSAGLSPAQFAPFPSIALDPSQGPTASGLVLCHGSDKNHLFDYSAGLARFATVKSSPCNTLSSGPTYLSWPVAGGATGQSGLVASAADSFHLNFNRAGAFTAPPSGPVDGLLFLNDDRGDAVFCGGPLCRKVQTDSKYHIIADEGSLPSDASNDTVPLYFAWSNQNQDNWVTTSSASPGPGYTNSGNPDGFLWKAQDAKGARRAVTQYVSSTGTHHVLTGSPAGKAWVLAHNYTAGSVLGYADPPPPPTPSPPTPPGVNTAWTFGVSGEVASVPAGFTQTSVIVYSLDGLTAAVDSFGTTLRAGYNTTKKDDEDVFLATLSLWTDNGAATLGAGWHLVTKSTPPPVPVGSSGEYLNINWSMVDEEVMGQVADSVRATGFAPRGSQLDCWWYPVNQASHPNWCGLDWQLPPSFYPNGTAGVRARTGVPLMLYFPALCIGESRWSNRNYTWTDTAHQGWLLPIAPDAERFFGDLFDYGIELASPKATDAAGQGGDVWPGVWVPPAVQAGWEGTAVAAYETDFFWNMMAQAPSMRTTYGAGEQFLQGMDTAAAARNMTVQLCAGNVPELLKSLTLPTMTQARASIDYAWDTPNPEMSSPHNWAAADPGWIFWATRMGLSKDNFWTTRGAFLNSLGYGPDGHNGYDPELHAVIAVLTGVVGLGDWVNMTNGTLLRRLARADGGLLRADRPLAPLDRMFSKQAGVPLPLQCGGQGGARLYGTHVSVGVESPDSPEITPTPTRRLVLHTGRDATLYRTVPSALALAPESLLQWLVVAVDVNCTFQVRRGDLYPLPSPTSGVLVRSYHGMAPCVDGADPIASGCLVSTPAHPQRFPEPTSSSTTNNDALFEAGTIGSAAVAKCEAPNECVHAVAVWQLWPEPGTATRVLPLGDLNAYASLSGYRFRIAATPGAGANMSLVAVGAPGERVGFTYLERAGTAAPWRVRVLSLAVGPDGRVGFDI